MCRRVKRRRPFAKAGITSPVGHIAIIIHVNVTKVICRPMGTSKRTNINKMLESFLNKSPTPRVSGHETYIIHDNTTGHVAHSVADYTA